MNDSTRTAADAGNVLVSTLRPLLAGRLAALRARYTLHGTAVVVALTAAAIAFFYGLDRWLLLPTPIRLFHTAVVVGLAGFASVRYLRYPLSKSFGEIDIAVWFERTFPELHQRLVSAVQLHAVADADLRNQSRPMIDALLVETLATVRALPLDRLFDPRPTRRVGGVALLLVTMLAAGSWWSPASMRAFVWRHLGFAASYPRATTLRLELPPSGPDLQRTDHDDLTELVLPAGADLHVSVLATGVVPKEVFLDVRTLPGPGEDRALTMSPRPGDRFRHVFRRLAGNFEFNARGGDDESGDRRVQVRTVHPPQVAQLLARVQPPAYTGKPAFEQRSGAIEALVGSDVELTVTTTMPVREATMVFLESGRRLPLTASTPEDDSVVAATLRGRFAIESSDRYQIELVAANGLRNPNPGTYPIAALQDYAPIGRWLLPEDEGLALLPTAILCLRLDAHDDAGLTSVSLALQHGPAEPARRELLPAATTFPRQVVLSELIEVRDILGNDPKGTTGIVMTVTMRDNKTPVAGETELPPRIVQIVDEPQLTANIARLFRGLREEISQSFDLQADRRARLEDLTSGEPIPGGDLAQALTGIEVGQGRITNSTERVHRGLMRAFDVHLWNRLEPGQNPDKVVEAWRARAATLTDAVALDPDFYRQLQSARAAGTIGALEQCLDPILLMVGLADAVATTHGPAVTRALTEAQVARNDADRIALQQKAIEGQKQIEAALQQLLLQLEEWNDYQDLIQEVRAMRDAQRDLQGRTEDARGKK